MDLASTSNRNSRLNNESLSNNALAVSNNNTTTTTTAPSSSESSTNNNNGNPLVESSLHFMVVHWLSNYSSSNLNNTTAEQNEKIQKIASELKDIFSSAGSFNGCSNDSSAGKNKTYEDIMKQFPGVPSQQLQHLVKSAHSLFPCDDDNDKTDDELLFQKPVLYEASKKGNDKTKQPLHFPSRIVQCAQQYRYYLIVKQLSEQKRNRQTQLKTSLTSSQYIPDHDEKVRVRSTLIRALEKIKEQLGFLNSIQKKAYSDSLMSIQDLKYICENFDSGDSLSRYISHNLHIKVPSSTLTSNSNVASSTSSMTLTTKIEDEIPKLPPSSTYTAMTCHLQKRPTFFQHYIRKSFYTNNNKTTTTSSIKQHKNSTSLLNSVKTGYLASQWSHKVTINAHLYYPVYCLCFDKTGQFFLTGADDHLCKLFTIEGVLVQTLRGHVGVIADLDVSTDNVLLATASEDGSCRIWSLYDGSPIAILRGHFGGANMISFSKVVPYRLTSTSSDGLARVWDLREACKIRCVLAKERQDYICFDDDEEKEKDTASIGQAQAQVQMRQNQIIRQPGQQQAQAIIAQPQQIPLNNIPAVPLPPPAAAAAAAALPQQPPVQLQPQQQQQGEGEQLNATQRLIQANSRETFDEGVLLLNKCQHGEPLPHQQSSSNNNNNNILNGGGAGAGVINTRSVSAHQSSRNKTVNVICLSRCPLGGHFATGSDDGLGRIWADNEYDPKLEKRDSSSSSTTTRYSLLNQQKQSLNSSTTSSSNSNSLSSGKLLASLSGHLNTITDIEYSHAGDRLLTASQKDGVVRIWSWGKDSPLSHHSNNNMSAGNVLHSHSYGQHAKNDLSQIMIRLSPHNHSQSSSSHHAQNNNSRRTNTNSSLRNRQSSSSSSSSSNNSNGNQVVCDVAVWSNDDAKVFTSQSIPLPKKNKNNNNSDNEPLIAPESHIIYAWDSRTGNCLLGIMNAHQSPCPILAVHPTNYNNKSASNDIVASAGVDGSVKIWSFESGEIMYQHKNIFEYGPSPSNGEDGGRQQGEQTKRGKPCGYLDGGFSPDGLSLVLTDDSGRITILDSFQHHYDDVDDNATLEEQQRRALMSNSTSQYAHQNNKKKIRNPIWMREQYFANDYYDLDYDVNGYAIERGSQAPPHLAPRASRVNHTGEPVPWAINLKYNDLKGPIPLFEKECQMDRQMLKLKRIRNNNTMNAMSPDDMKDSFDTTNNSRSSSGRGGVPYKRSVTVAQSGNEARLMVKFDQNGNRHIISNSHHELTSSLFSTNSSAAFTSRSVLDTASASASASSNNTNRRNNRNNRSSSTSSSRYRYIDYHDDVNEAMIDFDDDAQDEDYIGGGRVLHNSESEEEDDIMDELSGDDDDDDSDGSYNNGRTRRIRRSRQRQQATQRERRQQQREQQREQLQQQQQRRSAARFSSSSRERNRTRERRRRRQSPSNNNNNITNETAPISRSRRQIRQPGQYSILDAGSSGGEDEIEELLTPNPSMPPNHPFKNDYLASGHFWRMPSSTNNNSTILKRKWLCRTESKSGLQGQKSYAPQVGDSVIYIPRVHYEVLSSFQGTSPNGLPWHQFPDNANSLNAHSGGYYWPFVKCTVENIRYRFPYETYYKEKSCVSIVAILTLKVTGIPTNRLPPPQRQQGGSNNNDSFPWINPQFIEPQQATQQATSTTRSTRTRSSPGLNNTHNTAAATTTDIKIEVSLFPTTETDFLIPEHLFLWRVNTFEKSIHNYNRSASNSLYASPVGLKLTNYYEAEDESPEEDTDPYYIQGNFTVLKIAPESTGTGGRSSSFISSQFRGTGYDCIYLKWLSSDSDSEGPDEYNDDDDGGQYKFSVWDINVPNGDDDEEEEGGGGGELDLVPPVPPPTLSDHERAHLLNIIKKLQSHPEYSPFCELVNTREYVDYLDMVEVPMFLSHIQKRLEQQYYTNVGSIVHDVHLIVINCQKYNGEFHDITAVAKDLKDNFLDMCTGKLIHHDFYEYDKIFNTHRCDDETQRGQGHNHHHHQPSTSSASRSTRSTRTRAAAAINTNIESNVLSSTHTSTSPSSIRSYNNNNYSNNNRRSTRSSRGNNNNNSAQQPSGDPWFNDYITGTSATSAASAASVPVATSAQRRSSRLSSSGTTTTSDNNTIAAAGDTTRATRSRSRSTTSKEEEDDYDENNSAATTSVSPRLRRVRDNSTTSAQQDQTGTTTRSNSNNNNGRRVSPRNNTTVSKYFEETEVSTTTTRRSTRSQRTTTRSSPPSYSSSAATAAVGVSNVSGGNYSRTIEASSERAKRSSRTRKPAHLDESIYTEIGSDFDDFEEEEGSVMEDGSSALSSRKRKPNAVTHATQQNNSTSKRLKRVGTSAAATNNNNNKRRKSTPSTTPASSTTTASTAKKRTTRNSTESRSSRGRSTKNINYGDVDSDIDLADAEAGRSSVSSFDEDDEEEQDTPTKENNNESFFGEEDELDDLDSMLSEEENDNDEEPSSDEYSDDDYRPETKKTEGKKKRGRKAAKKPDVEEFYYPDLKKWPYVPRDKMHIVGLDILNYLKRLDKDQYFHIPVIEAYPSITEAYLQSVDEPMDFRTIMEERMDDYTHIDDLQQDLIKVFKNCCKYNGEGTEFWYYAVKIWKQLTVVFTKVCIRNDVSLPRRWSTD